MKINKGRTGQRKALQGLCLILACGLILPIMALAGEHARNATPPPHGAGWIQHMPPDHHVIIIGGNRFFFHNGIFFQQHRQGFFVVPAPRHALVPVLPLGFATLYFGGGVYYYHTGVYYRQAPGGYEVIEPPQGLANRSPASESSQAYPSLASVLVAVPSLNVRVGPGDNYPVLAVVDEGTTLLLRGSENEWLQIELPDGRLGWVREQYTVPYVPEPGSPTGWDGPSAPYSAREAGGISQSRLRQNALIGARVLCALALFSRNGPWE